MHCKMPACALQTSRSSPRNVLAQRQNVTRLSLAESKVCFLSVNLKCFGPSLSLSYSTTSGTRFPSSLPSLPQGWKDVLIEKQLKLIEAKRQQKVKSSAVSLVGLDKLDPVRYKLVCPACEKPNALLICKVCTACNFPLSPLDATEVDENVFLKIISQQDEDHRVVFRDEEIVIFEDKYKISHHHLDAIPTKVIKDVTVLGAEHIPLITKLHDQGIQALRALNPVLFRNRRIEDFVITGFNYPVSVYHLHLHLVLPPLKHTNAFKHPRFLPYYKVLRDLNTHGRVITYQENPNTQEGERYWRERIEKNHNFLLLEQKKLFDEEQHEAKEL